MQQVPRRLLGCGRWERGDPLERVAQHWGRRFLQTVRPYELAHEPTIRARCGPRRIERLHQLRVVLLEAGARPQQASTDVEQVVKVECSLLVVRELRGQDGVHRAINDGGLEESARIQADDSRAVVERLEIVLFRRGIHGVRPVERDVLEAQQVDRLPFLHPRGMRPDQNRGRSKLRDLAFAKTRNPPDHELRFHRTAPEQSGAYIQDERSI